MIVDEAPAAVPTGADAKRIAGEIAAIFARCLNVSSVGIDDNFFELGGSSLGGARITTWLEARYPGQCSQGAVFQHPTPRRLAEALLGQRSWPPGAATATIVPLNSGDCAQRPVFFIPGAPANPWVFRPLMKAIALTRPALALRPPDLDWPRDVLTIEEMVGHYLSEIRRVQPRGPYSVVGYSFGGSLAFEIAIRMIADGQPVEHLVMFDTRAPVRALPRWWAFLKMRTHDRFRRWLLTRGLCTARAMREPQDLAFCFGAKALSRDELRGLIAYAFPRSLADRSDMERLDVEELSQVIVERFTAVLSQENLQKMMGSASGATAASIVKAQKIRVKNSILSYQYTPSGTFPGVVTIYRCRGGANVRRWKRFAARVDLRVMSPRGTSHETFMGEANIPFVAADFQELIDGRGAHTHHHQG